MLEAVGTALTWVAYVAIVPLMTLPLAVLSASQRFRATLIWLALSLTAIAAGIGFSHFAADLPRFQVDNRYIVWIFAFASIIIGAGLTVGPAIAVKLITGIFSTVVRATGRGAIWLVVIMALVQFTIVILRYVFGVNFIWMQESVTYMHGAVFLLAGGYAMLTDDHVRVDIFYRDAPPKRKALVDFAGTYLFLFPFCLLIVWAATPYVGNAWNVREGSTEQSGIQAVYLLKTLIPIFALLFAMAGFVIAARAADILRGRDA